MAHEEVFSIIYTYLCDDQSSRVYGSAFYVAQLAFSCTFARRFRGVTREAPEYLQCINLSQAWKHGCDAYVRVYNAFYCRQGRAMSSRSSAWMKMVSAQPKAAPKLNIFTLTREDLSEQNLPCRFINTAIDAGFLDDINDSGRFTQLI